MPRSETQPSPQAFAALAQTHTLVPVYRTVAADLETPVSAFLRVAAAEPEAFLLESVEGGEHVGRYTFIGIRPYKRMTARGRNIVIESPGSAPHAFTGDIFEELKRALEGHTPAKLHGLPPFTAGAVGFFAYDVVRSIESLPNLAADELHVPDALLMFFDEVLAFDHVKKAIHLMVTTGARDPLAPHQARAAQPQTPGEEPRTSGAPFMAAASSSTSVGNEGVHPAYTAATLRLDRLESLLDAALIKPHHAPIDAALTLTPRTSREDFLAAVETTREYIRAGDVFQCVLSQRFDCTPGVDAFEIYRSLRIVNPSPYMYFLRFPKQGTAGSEPDTALTQGLCHIVGSSPELLVRVQNHDGVSKVEYRPIAGTRPRGADEAADRALEASLRNDEKEVAEHIMLVDLGRNDVGRVAEFGTVKVTDLMFIERYSHVMHLVSRIEGTLKAGLAPIDAFRACFPAGTLSGAPKIRAMQIIEELEPARRGIYGGSIFYADFSGNLDSCIAIRTLFMDGEKGYIQAGAGIVADSIAENEFEECRNKAAAVVRAIERARTS